MDRNVAKLIGARIRKLRKARGLTQAQLAELGQKTVETISNFERGKTLPRIMTLYELANQLGTTMRDLVDFNGPVVAPVGDGLAQRVRLLAKADRQLAAEFIDFLAARPKRRR